MYATGTAQDFLSRLRCLPVNSGEMVSFRNEGLSYAPALLPATKVQWNQVFAKSWAQTTNSVVYYFSGAF